MIPTYLGTQIIVNGLLICVTFYAVLRYKLHFINVFLIILLKNIIKQIRAVVVDQLAELMLTLPKVRGLNPVTVEIYNEHVDC